MKLSLHLFRPEVQGIDGLIKEKYVVNQDEYRRLNPTAELGFPCEAFLLHSQAKTPKWVEFIHPFFAVEDIDIQNKFNSFVLLFQVGERCFAATFGYGYSAIDESKTEPNFGLKVVLNSVDEKGLRFLETRNIDLVTKQQSTNLNIGSPIAEFDINERLDWVKKMSGKAIFDFTKNMTGADGLSFNVDCRLTDLPRICAQVLERFSSDDYKQRYPFIDYITPLSSVAPLVVQLDSELFEKIRQRDMTRIAIALPDIPDWETLDYFEVQGPRRVSMRAEDVTLEAIYEFLDILRDEPDDYDKIKIIGIKTDDSAATRKRSLLDFLVAEILIDGEPYVYSLKQWFKADRDYVEAVRREIAVITDVTGVLNMPPMNLGEREDDYNRRTANARNWLLLDKALFRLDRHDKIEICDLLSENHQFVCVKKMTSSATLSHLFAQGSVSANLLKELPEYRRTIEENASIMWPGFVVHDDDVVFVFAIPTRKPGSLHDSMFFFSQINLLEHVKTIRRAGFRANLCKIDIA